jgi:hypothetical protein
LRTAQFTLAELVLTWRDWQAAIKSLKSLSRNQSADKTLEAEEVHRAISRKQKQNRNQRGTDERSILVFTFRRKSIATISIFINSLMLYVGM